MAQIANQCAFNISDVRAIDSNNIDSIGWPDPAVFELTNDIPRNLTDAANKYCPSITYEAHYTKQNTNFYKIEKKAPSVYKCLENHELSTQLSFTGDTYKLCIILHSLRYA